MALRGGLFIIDLHDICFVINRKDRPVRRETVKLQMKNRGIKYQIWDAYDDSNNHGFGSGTMYSCTKTHYDIICHALENKLKSIIIFEDDVVIRPDFHDLLVKSLKDLPKDWDFYYMGGVFDENYHRVTENILKVDHCWLVHAYIINYRSFEKVIGLLEKNFNHPKLTIDEFYAVSGLNMYFGLPMIAAQRIGISDVTAGVVCRSFGNHRFINIAKGIDGFGLEKFLTKDHMRKFEQMELKYANT